LQVCRQNPGEKGKYIKIIVALLAVRSPLQLHASTSVTTAPVTSCMHVLLSAPSSVLLVLLTKPLTHTLTRALVCLQSSSTAVVYECAVTLVSLSSAPTAVRAAANCYCQLLVSQSDNNVKLIVLDRLVELKGKHREVRCF
jgi:Adaptin N terminal region